MITVVLATLVAVAVDDGLPFFTRDEPHLQGAHDAVAAGDPDLALEHARAALAQTDDERAIVEYDVGQILVARARADAKAAQEAKPADGQQASTPQPPKLDDARAGLERAAGLARDPRLISEAQLAAGNAALEMGKLEEAISSLRRALIADRTNVRARRNLQRALELKQQQPPQDQKDGEQKDGEKKDGEKKDGEKKDGEKKDGEKKDGEKKDGEKNDGEQEEDQGAGQPKEGKDKGEEPAQPSQKKPTSKEEAKRVLQGIRSRERPLTPMEMRGTERQRPKEGKDW